MHFLFASIVRDGAGGRQALLLSVSSMPLGTDDHDFIVRSSLLFSSQPLFRGSIREDGTCCEKRRSVLDAEDEADGDGNDAFLFELFGDAEIESEEEEGEDVGEEEGESKLCMVRCEVARKFLLRPRPLNDGDLLLETACRAV